MNKKVLILLLGILLVLSVSGLERREYILLEINYSEGQFTLINKTLEGGYYPTLSHDSEKPYVINLVSGSEEVLYSLSFDPTLLYTDAFYEEQMEGNVEILDDAEFFVIVPSVREGNKVEIFKDGEKVFEEEVYDVGATPCRIK